MQNWKLLWVYGSGNKMGPNLSQKFLKCLIFSGSLAAIMILTIDFSVCIPYLRLPAVVL